MSGSIRSVRSIHSTRTRSSPRFKVSDQKVVLPMTLSFKDRLPSKHASLSISTREHSSFSRSTGTRSKRESITWAIVALCTKSDNESCSNGESESHIPELMECLQLARNCIMQQRGGQRDPNLKNDDFAVSLTSPAALKSRYPNNINWEARNVMHFLAIRDKEDIQHVNSNAGVFEMLDLNRILNIVRVACPQIKANEELKDYYEGRWTNHGRFLPFLLVDYFALMAMITLKLHPTLTIPIGRLIKASLAQKLASEAVEQLNICGYDLGSKVPVRLDVEPNKFGGAQGMLTGFKLLLKEDMTGMIPFPKPYARCKNNDLIFYPRRDKQGKLLIPGPLIDEIEIKRRGPQLFANEFGDQYERILEDLKMLEGDMSWII